MPVQLCGTDKNVSHGAPAGRQAFNTKETRISTFQSTSACSALPTTTAANDELCLAVEE